MLYTINEANKSVVFELPLYKFFGKSWNRKSDKWLDSLQDYEENFFFNIDSDIDISDSEIRANVDEATALLIKQGYTKEEIDLFEDALFSDIKRAMRDAWRMSYESEWLKKFYQIADEDIRKQLEDNLTNNDIPYKLLDSIGDEDFRRTKTEQEHLRFEVLNADIINWLNLNGYEDKATDDDYIDEFDRLALDFSLDEVSTEFVDYYGTLGSTSNWLEQFEETCLDITEEIDSHRQAEADRLNNYELASLNLKSELQAITDYTNTYLPAEPKATKIKRQIKALESIIKN